MNDMCDINHFVVVVPIPNKTAATIAEHFMKHVFLKFGIYYLVILDDVIPFKCVLSAMCKELIINYDILAKINYKGLLVEKFHRLINETITIIVEDRGKNDDFVAAGSKV